MPVRLILETSTKTTNRWTGLARRLSREQRQQNNDDFVPANALTIYTLARLGWRVSWLMYVLARSVTHAKTDGVL